MVEQANQGKTPTGKEIMLKAGYSETSSTLPKARLFETKGWQELLATINDEVILGKIREIALDSSDKRACLSAIDMLLKLKERYPAGKLKVQAFNEEIERLSDEFSEK
jgi:hypothetical protein